MMIKCSIVIGTASNTSNPTASARRTGGFSEEYYAQAPFSDLLAASFNFLCQKRAGLLPTGFQVQGQRYQQVDPVGGSSQTAVIYPGSSGLASDIPQMCMHFRVKGVSVPNVRSVDLRGTPDARVVEGEYVPSGVYDQLINRFFQTLGGGVQIGGSIGNIQISVPFFFRGRDLTQTRYPLLSVAANGTFVTANPTTLLGGQRIQVLRTVLATGEQQGGFFYINNMISNTSGVLAGWNLGATTDGSIRVAATIYPQFPGTNPDTPQAIEKKVGRNSRGYRGRRSTRR